MVDGLGSLDESERRGQVVVFPFAHDLRDAVVAPAAVDNTRGPLGGGGGIVAHPDAGGAFDGGIAGGGVGQGAEPFDQTVGIDNATRLFVAARHPKSFVSLDKADHLLTRPQDAAYVAAVLSGWAERLLPTALPAPIPTEAGEIAVVDAGEGLFPQWVAAGVHRLRADEPVAVGGTDSGPAPYDYLLTALGSCTNMTLKMYADRKGWRIDRLVTRLRHDRIHAADCAECETVEGMVDRIERRILIEGPLDPEQRAKLLEIAYKCPVHRTLHNEIRVVTRLADGE